MPGPYYVDEECIGCEVCVDTAPNHFRMAKDRQQAYVFKQPETDAEKDNCGDAMGACPVDAIGNDG